MVQKESQMESLQKRIADLERQLAEAQAAIHALKADRADNHHASQLENRNILFSSEGSFRQAIQSAPYPLMIWREDGKIMMVNTAFTEISGYALDDIPTFEEWLHKAFGERFLEQPSLIFYEEFPGKDVRKSREFEITTLSGEKRIWDFSYAVLGTDQDGRWLMIAMAVDITERREIEEQLEENEHKFSIIFDKAPFAAALSRLPAGIITHINEEFERVFGYTRQEVLGKTSLEVGINPDPGSRARILEQIQAQGSARNVEARLHTKSGDERTFLLNLDQVSINGEKYILQTAQDITERKQAEESRQEMARLLELDRTRLSAILEHLPVGVWIGDAEGRLIRRNEEADRIWAGEAPLLQTIDEYRRYQSWDAKSGLPLESQQYPMAVALRTGRHVEPVELRIRRFDGSEGFVLVSATPIKDEQGVVTGVVAVNVDITDRKRAEVALRESEQRYRGLFEQMQEGLVAAEVITNENGEPVDYRYLDVNPATERQFGIPREQFIGRTYTEVLPEGDLEWIKILGQVALTGEPASVERYGLASRKWFEAHAYSPRPGQFINILTDITKRKQAEEALRNSEERFSKAFHSSPDAIIISRIQDGLIIEVNESWRGLFGHDPAEVMGRTSIELDLFVNPDDRSEAVRRIQEQGYVRNFELEIRRKSGEIRLASLSAERIEVHGEAALLTVLRDITERKQAEQQLLYQAKLLASVNDAIVGSDAGYRLTAWNAAAESIYGWKAEEVLGRNGLEILQTDWAQEQAEEMRHRIAETGSWRGEATQLRKDGTRIPVEVSSIMLRNEQGEVTGYVSVNRDITERKKVERALKASEAKMRAVFRALTEGVVFLNREGVVEEANDAVELTYEHTMEELSDPELDPRTRIIRPDGTLFPVEEQPAIVSLHTGKTVRDVELGVPTRDGKISWRLVNAQPVLDDQGNLLGAVASFFDITERKLAEQALRESEERFRSLADSMPQLVWTALPDGSVDYYNKRHLEYKQIKQMQGQDWDWAPVLHPDDTQATVDAWLHSVETGDIYQIEHRVRMADGSYRWHLSRGIPMIDEKGRIIRWFGTATDIHDLKLAEEQLKVYAGRLEKSNRELEQFAFMASHDLQEPLRKIEMFGDLLLERASGLQETERSYLDRMRNAAGRMRGMIEGLLQISRVITQGKSFVQVNMFRLTQEVLSDLEDQIRSAGGKVEVGSLPAVFGDPLQLRQLMQNLIGNALKYRQPGKPPEVRIFAEKIPDRVMICVQDKGIGFLQEDADRIFEPFQRLVGRNQYEGSGIGLAICRRIVERHDGEIAAISEPGQGTVFIVTLPKPPDRKSK